MESPSINIQGNIISGEILDRIRSEDIKYQQPGDFGLDRKTTVRDEIGIAWAAARAHWTAFKLRIDRLKAGETGAAETRNSWMIPLLRELGFDVEKSSAFTHPDTQKTYAISHRAANLNGFPIHIMGYHDDLNQRRETSGPRLSPHALAQEYLNITEHVYALVTNGRFLRLLRDATRLVRLSYLEVDLEKMMEEELYSDFAILFRLIHASRMPKSPEQNEESSIEYYHQESLASGSRIREKLSKAVEESIKELANGFLRHQANEDLRLSVKNSMPPADFYLYQLRLIYRLLFLIVTEERNLVFPETREESQLRNRKIYFENYSIERLRKLALRLNFVDGRKHDLWEGLKTTFHLFEDGIYGEKLGIKPLGSGLFSPDALGVLMNHKLSNESLLKVICYLTLFENDQHQLVRVNYSDLDVEEFGSVYEGLLEYNAGFTESEGQPRFVFNKGSERSRTGSHYTPEELVKPLIKHSLDYIIEEKLKQPDKEKSLLSIRVCDVACGSGHILLSAARRIAVELATVRTSEDQPSPSAIRIATRDVIRNCIYGVDKNPLAVELCKVALWLESHNPGEPLGFLDHHIKWGDSIVGLATKEDFKKGIPNEAFKTLPGDDPKIAAALLKRNRTERQNPLQTSFDFEGRVGERLDDLLTAFKRFNEMPERNPMEIQSKQIAYHNFLTSSNLKRLTLLADIQTAQFFFPKSEDNKDYLITDATFHRFLRGEVPIPYITDAQAAVLSATHGFFHWFLEFPEVFIHGGFDCVVGNPPFLGGQKLSGNYGDKYLQWLRTWYAPAGAVDLVTYFFRRIFTLLKPGGFQSLIATNTVAQGGAREGGLDVILSEGGSINHAVKSMRWPGLAAVEVALVSLHKGTWKGPFILDQRPVSKISAYLDDNITVGNPFPLKQNEGKSFQGSIVLGKGFVLEPHEAKALIEKNPKNKDVLFPYLNGDDLNNNPDQSASRWVINFFDWPLDRYSEENWQKLEKELKNTIARHCRDGVAEILAPPSYAGPVAADYPDCLEIVERLVKPVRLKMKGDRGAEFWWQFLRIRKELYNCIDGNEKVNVIALTSKTVAIGIVLKDQLFSHSLGVFAGNHFAHFSFLQSFAHFNWAWKYASSMKSDLRYTPSDCFETIPLPNIDSPTVEEGLSSIGISYHEYRQYLMLTLQLGLTQTYHAFHAREISSNLTVSPDLSVFDRKTIEKQHGKEAWNLWNQLQKTPDTCTFEEAVAGIIRLRELHVEMDQAVLEAYGWQDIALRHDFYEVDYLPENDRVRFTIHPEARREVLKRLLELNHRIHEEEVAAGLWDKKTPSKGNKVKEKTDGQYEMEI